jgi:hypothetical protein
MGLPKRGVRGTPAQKMKSVDEKGGLKQDIGKSGSKAAPHGRTEGTGNYRDGRMRVGGK